MSKAYLVLENGTVFEGRAIGYRPDSALPFSTVGELVFTTGMTGYLETLTDPSYAGQIIMQTFPMIGNYGVIPEDFEGDTFACGYVVRELSEQPSNFRSVSSMQAFLQERKIPGICDIDTRAVTRLIREEGVMNACICSEIPADLNRIRSYCVKDAVSVVSTTQRLEYPAETAALSRNQNKNGFHVVLLDYGAKRNIIRSLTVRGCYVTLLPHNTPADEILSLHPDGLMLSNGPGDPADNTFEIEQIGKLLGKLPIFGICLGHQLCALAAGGHTYKLKYGHRGANQPVTDGIRTWITTQNHGYAVDRARLPENAQLSFWNANDDSCEGLDYHGLNCFTVQFHPEACAGPRDTSFLFDRFLNMMRKGENGNAQG